jgi:hypothetical protein
MRSNTVEIRQQQSILRNILVSTGHFVWTLFIAICLMSWLFATNDSAPDLQGTNWEHAPQSNTSATNVSATKPRDPYAESQGRPGRRF